jgi:NAD(P)-dependent dehydrogenase (short-subunit alcohol dehydrogenase family)
VYTERLRLDNKVAMVIGAAGGGIGTAMSLGLAELGATVVGVARDGGRLAEVETAVRQAGGAFHPMVADVARDGEVEGVVESAFAKFGVIHCLANVVGGSHDGPPGPPATPVHEYQVGMYEATFDRNLRYVIRASGLVVSKLISTQTPGSIVNFSSMLAHGAAPGNALYAMSKTALESLTRSMAAEYARYNIRVNAVGVGQADSDRSRRRKAHSAELRARAPHVPPPPPMMPAILDARGWRCEADEVAASALFLLSDLASFITGQTLVVDGGRSMRNGYEIPAEVWQLALQERE